MNLLLFGATGFIGRNLLEFYSKDKTNKILAIGKSRSLPESENVKFDHYDLTFKDNVQCAFGAADEYFGDEKYTVIQAAATTSGAKDTFANPLFHVTDNAIINSMILREEQKHNVDIHVFFSCTVMFSGHKGLVNIDTPILEIDDRYAGAGWTKVYIEKMCEFCSKIGKTKYIAIRHSNIYGPYDKFELGHSHFLSASITKVMTTPDGGDIIVWGDGYEERDFVYVSDLCDFVDERIKESYNPLNFTSSKKFRLVSCVSGQNIETNEVVKKIIAASGKKLRILNDRTAPSIPVNFYFFPSFKQKISLDEGLKKTIDWWKENVGK